MDSLDETAYITPVLRNEANRRRADGAPAGEAPVEREARSYVASHMLQVRTSIDDLVGARGQSLWDSEPELLGRLRVDH